MQPSATNPDTISVAGASLPTPPPGARETTAGGRPLVCIFCVFCDFRVLRGLTFGAASPHNDRTDD